MSFRRDSGQKVHCPSKLLNSELILHKMKQLIHELIITVSGQMVMQRERERDKEEEDKTRDLNIIICHRSN